MFNKINLVITLDMPIFVCYCLYILQRIFVEDRTPSGMTLSDHYGISVKFRRGTNPLTVYRRICPNNPGINSAIPFAPVNVSNNTELMNICP